MRSLYFDEWVVMMEDMAFGCYMNGRGQAQQRSATMMEELGLLGAAFMGA